MSIPVMKPFLGEEEAEAAAEAVRSGWVAQGPRVARFEAEFAAAMENGHGVATSSCTTALHLALFVAGVEPGDDVVVPSLSFIATTNVVRYLGANPVFADVDPATQNLTPDTVAAVLTPATSAVIVVDQAGIPADLTAFADLARAHDLAIIEDAACAAGSTYRDRPVGADGALVAFSFHPRKLLTTGEGGMLVTRDEALAARARRLREHGMSVSAMERHASGQVRPESYLDVGFNYRMTDIQAAVGLVQLGRLPALVAQRRQLAAEDQRMLSGIPGLVTADDPPWGTTNYQSFWVLLPDNAPVGRDEVMAALVAAGVSPRRGIMAAHLEPCYAGHPHAALPVTERLTRDSLILPLHHELTGRDQEMIVDVIATCLGGG